MQEFDDVRLGLEVRKQRSDAFDVLRRPHVAEQIGLPAYDQLIAGLGGPGPRSKAGIDQPCRDRVEFAARAQPLGLNFRRDLRQRAPANPGVQIIAGLDERRGGQPGRRDDHAVLDRAVLRHQDRQRLFRLQAQEFHVLERWVELGGEHDSGAAGQVRKDTGGLRQRAFESAAFGGGPNLAVDSRPFLPAEIPNSSNASTKKRRPCWVGSRPALAWGARIKPSSSRSCITLRTEAGDREIGSMRDKCREPTGSPVVRYDSTMRRKISRERAFKFASAPSSAAGRSAGEAMAPGRMAVRAAARKTIGRARSSRAPLRDAQGCRNRSRPPKVTPSPSQDPTPLCPSSSPAPAARFWSINSSPRGSSGSFASPASPISRRSTRCMTLRSS